MATADKKTRNNWLVCVDDSPSSIFAFKAAKTLMREDDGVFILHVGMKSGSSWWRGGEDKERSDLEMKRVLAYYALKVQRSNIKNFRFLGSYAKSPEKRICQAVRTFDITQLVLGRRTMGYFKQLAATKGKSQYIMERAECNVIIGKPIAGKMVPDEPSMKSTIVKQDVSHVKKLQEITDKKDTGETHRFFTYDIDMNRKVIHTVPEATQEVLEVKETKRVAEPIRDMPEIIPGGEVKETKTVAEPTRDVPKEELKREQRDEKEETKSQERHEKKEEEKMQGGKVMVEEEAKPEVVE